MLFIWWRTYHWAEAKVADLRCHWGIQVEKYAAAVGAKNASEVSFIGFFGYDKVSLLDEHWAATTLPQMSVPPPLATRMAASRREAVAGAGARIGGVAGRVIAQQIVQLLVALIQQRRRDGLHPILL